MIPEVATIQVHDGKNTGIQAWGVMPPCVHLHPSFTHLGATCNWAQIEGMKVLLLSFECIAYRGYASLSVLSLIALATQSDRPSTRLQYERSSCWRHHSCPGYRRRQHSLTVPPPLSIRSDGIDILAQPNAVSLPC